MSVCLFVCLFLRVYLGHFETNRDTLWQKIAFYPWEGSKTIIFLIKKSYCPFSSFLYDFFVNFKSDYKNTNEVEI